MGWFREKTNEFIRSRSDGVVTHNEVEKLINDSVKNIPEFYELEPAEVLAVYLSEEDLIEGNLIDENGNPDWRYYGSIRARMLLSGPPRPIAADDEEEENLTLDKDPSALIARPHETNIKEYPYPGELIVIVDYLGEHFYTRKLNLFNSVNNNSDPGLSTRVDWTTSDFTNPKTIELLTKDFRSDSNIKQVRANEGDIIFHGRFGQSMRLGSNNRQAFDVEGNRTETTESDNEPNLIMRINQGVVSENPHQPVEEDVNLDGSSLYMTSDEVVPINHHKSKVKELDPKFKTESSGNQIILTSDRLVFNSRKDTFLYSNNDINLVSKNRIVLEAHENVYLGSAPSQGQTTGYPNGDVSLIQPVLLGDTTIKIISDLMQSIMTFAMNAAPTMGTCVGFPIPLDHLAPACASLIEDLGEAKANLEKAKSTKVHVVKE